MIISLSRIPGEGTGYLSFLACATRLSMTCSNASLSPSALSNLFCQYSNTSFALSCSPLRWSICIFNSSSVKPCSAASVVAHNCIVLLMSSSGGGGGPLRFRSGLEPDESTEVDDSFSRLIRPRGPPLFRPSEEGRGERSPGMCIEGRMSFFCFEAGRISSRSTGTPRETRNSRRIRERTQSGGCSGGGATS
jgi:hypothetical protein